MTTATAMTTTAAVNWARLEARLDVEERGRKENGK